MQQNTNTPEEYFKKLLNEYKVPFFEGPGYDQEIEKCITIINKGNIIVKISHEGKEADLKLFELPQDSDSNKRIEYISKEVSFTKKCFDFGIQGVPKLLGIVFTYQKSTKMFGILTEIVEGLSFGNYFSQQKCPKRKCKEICGWVGKCVGKCVKKCQEECQNQSCKKDSLTILIQFTKIISKLHEKKIYYKVLKPENIIITKTNEMFIYDLGIPRISDAARPVNYNKNNNRYIAPEVFKENEKPDIAKTELWAVGCILVEAQTGLKTWEKAKSINDIVIAMNKVDALTTTDMMPFDEKAVEIKLGSQVELIEIYRKILQIDPNERMTIDEITEELEFLLQTLNDG